MLLHKTLQSTQFSSQALEAQAAVLARLGYKKEAQEMTWRFHQDTMAKPVMRTQLFTAAHTWKPSMSHKADTAWALGTEGGHSNAGHQQRECQAKFKSCLRCEVPVEAREAPYS